MEMETLRRFLDSEYFNWEKGRIIIQTLERRRGSYSPVLAAREVKFDDPILDEEFDAGYGSANCPNFIAEDEEAIYFPSQYDGSTTPEKVFKNLSIYLNCKVNTPYPGG